MAQVYSSAYMRAAPKSPYAWLQVWVPNAGSNVTWHWSMGELPAKSGDLREEWQPGRPSDGNQGEWWFVRNPFAKVIGQDSPFDDSGTVYAVEFYNESHNRWRVFRLHATYELAGVQKAGHYSAVVPATQVRHQILLNKDVTVTGRAFWARRHFASGGSGAWTKIDPQGGLVVFYQPYPEHDWMKSRMLWDLHEAIYSAPSDGPGGNPVAYFETLFVVSYQGKGSV